MTSHLPLVLVEGAFYFYCFGRAVGGEKREGVGSAKEEDGPGQVGGWVEEGGEGGGEEVGEVEAGRRRRGGGGGGGDGQGVDCGEEEGGGGGGWMEEVGGGGGAGDEGELVGGVEAVFDGEEGFQGCDGSEWVGGLGLLKKERRGGGGGGV